MADFYTGSITEPRIVAGPVIVFDIGGHGLRAALADQPGGQLIRQVDIPEETRFGRDESTAFVSLLRRGAAALDAPSPAAAIIGVPGPVADGRISRLPTLYPNHETQIDILAQARRLWSDAQLWVCNDITAAGYAFVAKGHRNFCIFTCGSGIGGKLFLNGAPVLGNHGMGGEFGHWRVPGAPDIPCDCGGYGHLGALASGRGAVRLAKYLADQNPEAFAASPLARECGSASNVSAEALACHFRSGDDWASQVIDGSARALGCTLALIHLCCAVEDFFVTGGFATALGADFGLRVGHHAAHSAWPTDIDWSRAVHIMDPNVEYGLTGAAHIPLFAAPGSTMAASCG